MEAIAPHLEAARRIARLWCRRAEDADDAAQEAVLRLLQSDPRPANVVPWLYVVTKRLCARRTVRETARAEAEVVFESRRFDAPIDPDLRVDVSGVLDRLNSRDRRLLTALLEGAVSSEVAAVFGCHVRDVGQLVARARRNARKLMNRRT